MNKHVFNILLISMLVCFTVTSFAAAGQVVTDDIRQWASTTLKNEKSLDAVSGKNTIAVLYFRNSTGKTDMDPLQKGMALMLITDLSEVKGLQVVERTRLQALVEEMGLGTSGLVEGATVPRMGRLLSAKWLAGGGISERAGLIEVRADVLDAGESKILGQPAGQGALSEIFRIEKDILFGMIGLLKIDVSAEDEKRLRKPCTTNYDAFVSLEKGVEESDRGNYGKAAEAYEKALKVDPSICIAGSALDELNALGLIGGKSRTTELLQSLREETSLTNQLGTKNQTKFGPANAGTPTGVDVTFPKSR